VNLWKRIRDPSSAAQCSFCTATRQQVKFLVAKDARTAICDRCAALAVSVVDSDAVRTVVVGFPTLGLCFTEIIETLPDNAWHRLPELARGLIALRSTPALDMLRLARVCSARNHDDARIAAVVLLSELIGVAEFRFRHAIELGYLAYDLGDFAALDRVTATFVSTETLGDDDMIELATLTLLCDAIHGAFELDEKFEHRARSLLQLARTSSDAQVLARAQGVAAWLLHRRGFDPESISLYTAIESGQGLLPRYAVPYGDAQLRSGNGQLAIALWQSVVESTTATNYWHREATSRLLRPDAAYR
jgi:hypothetical protein